MFVTLLTELLKKWTFLPKGRHIPNQQQIVMRLY